jgi:glyoxylase-like metal-dependent hydrolase (beta-lactamase superfamily II)
MTPRDLAAGPFAYRQGLHALGDGAWAWLQPDGGWGWSNAGLIADSGEALLVDTLFDLALTREMLVAMRRAEPAAARIDTLVNTHANGDHCFGNELVAGAEIVASRAAAAEMAEAPPERLQGMMELARAQDTPAARYVRDAFAPFDFSGITLTLPTRTFDDALRLTVGTKEIELLEVGPAHTRGDVLVHVAADRTVFTGDILFVDGTPLIWAGPVQNWIDACDRVLALDAETVVPGHGPITDRRGPEAVKAYLTYIFDETRRRWEAGLDAREAALDITLDDFSSWGDAERIAINVDAIYRELSGSPTRTDPLELFARVAEVAAQRRA